MHACEPTAQRAKDAPPTRPHFGRLPLPAGEHMRDGPELDRISHSIEQFSAVGFWNQPEDGLGLEIEFVALDDDLL